MERGLRDSLTGTFAHATHFDRDLSGWNVDRCTDLIEPSSTRLGSIAIDGLERGESDEFDRTFDGAASLRPCHRSNVRRSWSFRSAAAASALTAFLAATVRVVYVHAVRHQLSRQRRRALSDRSECESISLWNVSRVTVFDRRRGATEFNRDLLWNVAKLSLDQIFDGATNLDACNRFNIRRSWSFQSSLARSDCCFP